MGIRTGTVEAMSNKFGKTSILVDGNWFGSKYGFSCNKGDVVEFDDMGKNFVKNLKVISGASPSSSAPRTSGSSPRSAPGFPVPVDTKDRAIVRQNSLGHAVNLVSSLATEGVWKTWEEREVAMKAFAELSVEVARIFENYSSGDGDFEEAKELLEE